MRFLIDAQLPPALARWLAAQGHEAEHVADSGLGQAVDDAIWDPTQTSATVETRLITAAAPITCRFRPSQMEAAA